MPRELDVRGLRNEENGHGQIDRGAVQIERVSRRDDHADDRLVIERTAIATAPLRY